MNYDTIIGLEIHVQLNTKSKMFCRCQNLNEDLGKEPNTTVCPICLGHPGTLPIANRQAIEWTVQTGLALNCRINEYSKFDRKHYFYPDLPKAYQISQYDLPLCQSGALRVGDKDIAITRLHLEEDTGKLTHPPGKQYSLADYNRAGSPLMELVTEPVIQSAGEAKKFCQKYQQILRYLAISEADMEKGQMRCEVNISLQKPGSWKYTREKGIEPLKKATLNPKTEIKNIGSFRSVEKAIAYEIKRQTEALDSGETLSQETRGWNDARGTTVVQRSKEEAKDYRYFPDPDVAPVAIKKARIAKMKASLPELPDAKHSRFREQYGFSDYDAEVLTADTGMANYVEQVISELREWVSATKRSWRAGHVRLAKLTGNWVGTQLFQYFNETKTGLDSLKISAENFAEFITLIHENKVNSSAAQVIFKEMFLTGADPSHIMREQGLAQMEDDDVLEIVVAKVMAEHKNVVADYHGGKANALQFLVGQVMKESKGRANPNTAKDLLIKKIQ